MVSLFSASSRKDGGATMRDRMGLVATLLRRSVVALAAFSVLMHASWWLSALQPLTVDAADAALAPPPRVTILLRSRESLMSTGVADALEHYAACPDVGAMRIFEDAAVTWNLTKAHHALTVNGPSPTMIFASQPMTYAEGDDSPTAPAIANMVSASVQQLLKNAPPQGGGARERGGRMVVATAHQAAVLLASDDRLIDCEVISAALAVWSTRPMTIVGTIPLHHALKAGNSGPALDYRVSSGLDKYGSYSMVALDGAILDAAYIQQAAKRSSSRADGHQDAIRAFTGCDEVWLNDLIGTQSSESSYRQAPPLYVRSIGISSSSSARSSADALRAFSRRATVYLDAMSACVSHLASEQSGNFGLVWTRSGAAAANGASSYVPTSSSSGSSSSSLSGGIGNHNNAEDYLGHYSFPMVDDVHGTRRKYLVREDHQVAGVTAVLVMETRPNEVASAVRHLHSKCGSLIREAVVWNNHNATMNHHMLPYDDISVRYVIAPQNFASYARYLGCLLARYDICYFQHERMRPIFVDGLYSALLARPDVIVVASDRASALIVRRNMTVFDISTGRSSGFADMDEGAMVHKDLVRQFVARMTLDDSRSLHERVVDADLYFTYSQPVLPMVLGHATRTNNKARVFPDLQRIGKALAFAFTFAPSSMPAPGYSDPLSERYKYFRAPCVGNGGGAAGCAFATSVDAWPPPSRVDLGHAKPSLKPARYYGEVLADVWGEKVGVTMGDSGNALFAYSSAVDGDLKTTWRAHLPPKPSFIALELLEEVTITGVRLWCKRELPNKAVPMLQSGAYGQAGFEMAIGCDAEWKDGGGGGGGHLHLLEYVCRSPVRVQRVRLLIDTVNYELDIAEFGVVGLEAWGGGRRVQAARQFAAASGGGGRGGGGGGGTGGSAPLADLTTPPPPDLGNIVYVIEDDVLAGFRGVTVAQFCSGAKLALLEEACELGALYAGKVKLVYVGYNPRVTLRMLAQAFAVTGSTCDLEKNVKWEAVPETAVAPGAAAASPPSSSPASSTPLLMMSRQARLNARRLEVYNWWLKRKLSARVVIFDPDRDNVFSLVVRNKLDMALGDGDDGSSRAAQAPPVYVARAMRAVDGNEEGLVMADATMVMTKADYVSQAQRAVGLTMIMHQDEVVAGGSRLGGDGDGGGSISGSASTTTTTTTTTVPDRRIWYPLRTLREQPALHETPTTPAVEELILIVTPSTTPEDLDLFNAHALPVLQKRGVDIRIANVTELLTAAAAAAPAKGASTEAPKTKEDSSLTDNGETNMDARVKRPKWGTLRDVAYYVAIYPARVLWILDSSRGAAYFASVASVESARFVTALDAVPHQESRIVGWNATCAWTPEGFAAKARELVQGRYEASSAFSDRKHVRANAPSLIVEEWPIKRLQRPFLNPLVGVVQYLAELVDAHEWHAIRTAGGISAHEHAESNRRR
jgi:hypothetical protein